MGKQISKEKLKVFYCEEYYSIERLADYFHCSTSTIRRELRKCKIERNNKDLGLLRKIKIDRNELKVFYCKNWSLSKIAKQFNCSKLTIQRRLNLYDFPKRDRDKVLSSLWSTKRIKAIKRDRRGRLLSGCDYPIDYEYEDKASVTKRAKSVKGDKCEICGWDKASVDGHHKISTQNNGKHIVSNIVLVCPNCHRLIHKEIIKI